MDWIRRAPASISNTGAKRRRRFPIAPLHRPAERAAAPSQPLYGPSLASPGSGVLRVAGASCVVDRGAAVAVTTMKGGPFREETHGKGPAFESTHVSIAGVHGNEPRELRAMQEADEHSARAANVVELNVR